MEKMKLYQVTDPAFRAYGRVLTGLPVQPLLEALAQTPLPADTAYVASEPLLEAVPGAAELGLHLYGGLPAELGWCNGHNTKLNCLEYHRDSEFNLGTEDFILLLARRDEIENGTLDTGKVRAFRVPAGVLVEVYAATLHYTPCHADAEKGFRVLVALPAGTNEAPPALPKRTDEDQLLWARNKWLLAHADSQEARQGAAVRLTGENIDLAQKILTD